MTRSGLRLVLFLLLIAAVGAAGWQYYRLELDSVESKRETLLLDGFRDDARLAVEQARSSQQAYVAPGQGLGFWQTRFAEAIADMTGVIENLRATAEDDPEPTAALDAADRALKVYQGLDRKIRGFVDSGSMLMASDVVYEDGVKTSKLIVDGIDQAHRSLVTPHLDAVDNSLRQQRLLAAAAVGASLLVALLLVPRGRTETVVGDSSHGHVLSEEPDAAADWQLAGSREQAGSSAVAATPPPAAVQVIPPVAAPQAPAPRPDAAGESRDAEALAAAAQVCTDLARVKDGDELREALGRAARALDATGVIVWIADAKGRALKPLLTYGYPEEALRRIPTLPRDADNATAAAWREGLTQVVDATEGAPGAVAVPILGPQGCTGVLAAEIGHHREATGYTKAVGQIVAAQLAVLIPPATDDDA